MAICIRICIRHLTGDLFVLCLSGPGDMITFLRISTWYIEPCICAGKACMLCGIPVAKISKQSIPLYRPLYVTGVEKHFLGGGGGGGGGGLHVG